MSDLNKNQESFNTKNHSEESLWRVRKMEIIEDGKDIAVSVCPHCKKRVEITKSDWQEIKTQILAENPLAGLTNEELIYLKRLNEHVSNPVFSKFFVELFRRDKKGEID